MWHRVTLGVCLLGAAASLALGFGGCGWGLMVPVDALVVPLVAGPYVWLGLVAWVCRNRPAAAAVVLGVTLVLATVGVAAFGREAHRLHADPQYHLATRLTVLVVPVLQWLTALLTSLSLLVGCAWARWRVRERAG
jgi:hypothetical protein